jgi:hypothetical protein
MVHPTIRAGALDSAVVVNGTGRWINYGGCSGLLPRTGPSYHMQPGTVGCLGWSPIAPHSRYRIPNPVGATMMRRKSGWFRASPGKYWMVFYYTFISRPGTPPTTSERLRVAYAKLNVVR